MVMSNKNPLRPKDERGNLPRYHPGSTTESQLHIHTASRRCTLQPSNKGHRGNGRTRRGLSWPTGLVQPLNSQATFSGGRCEGLQPVTLFSAQVPVGDSLARAVPAYSSCSPSLSIQFVFKLYHEVTLSSTTKQLEHRLHPVVSSQGENHILDHLASSATE